MITAAIAEKSQTPGQLSNLLEKCIFFRLSIRSLGTKRSVSKDQVSVDADKQRLHVHKTILKCKEKQAIDREDRQIKSYLKWRCLSVPEFKSSIFATVPESVDEVDTRIQEFVQKRQEILVPEFLEVYEMRMVEDQRSLRSLWNAGDYPPVAEVKACFSVVHEYREFGVPGRLERVSPLIFRREAERTKELVTEIADQFLAGLTEQMRDVVNKVVESLTPGADGKEKKFRKGSLEKLLEFLQIFKEKNVTNARELEVLADTLRQITAGIDVKALRKSEGAREIVKQGFEKIKSQLDYMIEVAPERLIRFGDDE